MRNKLKTNNTRVLVCVLVCCLPSAWLRIVVVIRPPRRPSFILANGGGDEARAAPSPQCWSMVIDRDPPPRPLYGRSDAQYKNPHRHSEGRVWRIALGGLLGSAGPPKSKSIHFACAVGVAVWEV